MGIEEELRRVIPVIAALAAQARVPISIDTRNAEVMRRAAQAGARIINDVAALGHDPNALRVAAETGLPVVLMHAQGDPRTMQNDPRYDDVVLDVYDRLEARIRPASRPASRASASIVDPGIGFGKTLAHNLALLGSLSIFHGLGCPVLLGASRKSFIAKLDRAPPLPTRACRARWQPPCSAPPRACSSCACTMSPPRARRWRSGRPPTERESDLGRFGEWGIGNGEWDERRQCRPLPTPHSLGVRPAGSDRKAAFASATGKRHSGPDATRVRIQPTRHSWRARYFGTDGIRGLANRTPMTPEVALRVGMAAGKLFSNGGGRPHRVVIGKDTRLSGYMIESALVSGFTAVGMDVFLLGPMPTPAVAMMTRSLRADLGVMISASHNPYADNGIKLFDPDGYKLSDEAEARDRGADGRRHATSLLVPPDRIGRAKRIDSAQARYIEFAKRTLPRDIRLNGLQGRHRLRQRRRLQGGAGGAVGTGRRGDQDRRRAQRPQHQRGVRLAPTRGAVRQGARACAPTSASRSTATPTAW